MFSTTYCLARSLKSHGSVEKGEGTEVEDRVGEAEEEEEVEEVEDDPDLVFICFIRLAAATFKGTLIMAPRRFDSLLVSLTGSGLRSARK